MTNVNKCLETFNQEANPNQARSFSVSLNEFGETVYPPFKPQKFVAYSICVLNQLKVQFEEAQKLKSDVKFYPNYPENSHVKKEYNHSTQKNNQVVKKSFEEFENFCSEASNKTQGECEKVKFYNKCIARMTEAFLYWSKIDDSLTTPFLSRDTSVCQTEPEDTD